MTELTYQGFNYPAFYNGGYENGDTLPALKATGANSVALEDEYSIDVNNATIVADPGFTDSLASLGSTIKEAVADGLQVMVRPLIDFLNPSIDDGLTDEYRSYFNPSNPTAFFASYQNIVVAQAQVAQQNGAQVFCIGTELDQLTGPAYLSDWTKIITAVRAVFKGKLTYSAEWDDNTSPWQYGGTGLPLGTGDITTQISFWNQLDYVGIDEYAPLSDAANPTEAQLVAGWEQAPTDASVKAVTGNQSLISYFENVSAEIGKPLFFTELGYEDATDAASQPFGSSTNVVDQTLQTELYQAFGTAWNAENNGSLIGVNFWNWDPNKAETAPADGPNFSPQSNPGALRVIATDFAACFSAGTRILTAAGKMSAVEDLRVGDVLKTFDGAAGNIIWIGRRTIDLQNHRHPETVRPILIAAGALGQGLPWRDLIVSPDHALYLDGHLIPAKTLRNGFTIRQISPATVTYFHIELPAHGVLFAEGVAAESYLDTGNRGAFENGVGPLALNPHFAQSFRAADSCAPLLESGLVVETIRQRVLDLAGIDTSDDPLMTIRRQNGAILIESRSAIPGELNADPRDRRRLGVKIASLSIDGRNIPLDHPDLCAGWHDMETDGRWTNGRAVIPKSLCEITKNIQVSLAATLRYPLWQKA